MSTYIEIFHTGYKEAMSDDKDDATQATVSVPDAGATNVTTTQGISYVKYLYYSI